MQASQREKAYSGNFIQRRRCLVRVQILHTDESERRKRMLRHHGAVHARAATKDEIARKATEYE